MTKLLIVGGGRMGEALLGGLLDAGWAPPGEITVVEPAAARAAELRAAWPDVEVRDSPTPADGAILAVKPHTAAEVARSLTGQRIDRIVSVAAGVRTATLEAELPDTCAVIRAMPNTPALVRAGATAVAAGAHAGDDDLAWATELLGTVGRVVRVAESELDAVTGLSGSGPAYVFLMAEALIDAGVLNGLDRATATTLAIQTLLGSAQLLVDQVEHGDADPAALRAQVTSPGGTTAAGLAVLERTGVRAALLDAVTAAARRAGELG